MARSLGTARQAFCDSALVGAVAEGDSSSGLVLGGSGLRAQGAGRRAWGAGPGLHGLAPHCGVQLPPNGALGPLICKRFGPKS